MNIGKRIRSIDPEGRFVGYVREMDGVLIREKRCRYCGKWFTQAMPDGIEPAHCGNSACEYFHKLWLEVQAKRAGLLNEENKRFFNDPNIVKTVLSKAKDLSDLGIDMSKYIKGV